MPGSVGDCLVCDTDKKVLGCRKCATLYAWTPLLEKGYIYFKPLTKAKIRQHAPRGSDAWETR